MMESREIKELTRKIDMLTAAVARLTNLVTETKDIETIGAAEAAKRLGVKPATLRRAYAFLPRVKRGKSYVYLLSGIEKYLKGETIKG